MSSESSILLEAEGLTKAFSAEGGSIRVLDDVSLILRAGDSVSIRGESGCGKSTLLNVLSGLERPDKGRLRWRGKEVGKRSLSWLAGQRRDFIGFVFQSYYLAPELNALENVLLAARIHGKRGKEWVDRAEALLEQVGMKHRLLHCPTKLSGGERQRVALARALINDPPFILADEPTGNLDESTAEAVMDLLIRLVTESGKCLALVTHHPGFASRTERRLILHGGHLTEEDSAV